MIGENTRQRCCAPVLIGLYSVARGSLHDGQVRDAEHLPTSERQAARRAFPAPPARAPGDRPRPGRLRIDFASPSEHPPFCRRPEGTASSPRSPRKGAARRAVPWRLQAPFIFLLHPMRERPLPGITLRRPRIRCGLALRGPGSPARRGARTGLNRAFPAPAPLPRHFWSWQRSPLQPRMRRSWPQPAVPRACAP